MPGSAGETWQAASRLPNEVAVSLSLLEGPRVHLRVCSPGSHMATFQIARNKGKGRAARLVDLRNDGGRPLPRSRTRLLVQRRSGLCSCIGRRPGGLRGRAKAELRRNSRMNIDRRGCRHGALRCDNSSGNMRCRRHANAASPCACRSRDRDALRRRHVPLPSLPPLSH